MSGKNGVTVREKAVRFGKSATLVGVLSEPATPAPGAPAIVWLNSGILHRVGACRTYVQLARAMAAQGFTVLRFDYSGIGDSEARKDSLPFEESAVIETREAMDWLTQTKGTQRYVLAGLCSGADMAHETARVDDRVDGLVMFDPYAYRTRGFWMHYYAKRMRSLSVWTNWVKVRAKRLLDRAKPAPAEGAGDVTFEVPKYVRVFPARERVAADLQQFVGRGTELFVLFTGGLDEDYNHRGQYLAAFPEVPFGARLEEHYMRDADHIFTGLEHQGDLVERVTRWIARFVPAAGAAGTAAPRAGAARAAGTPGAATAVTA
jgi:dienelactone hydrolase